MKPLIKWVGSKRRLLPQLLPLLPPLAELAYVEPFLGSGALFFEAGHTAATCYLSDANYELINTYRMLRGNDQHKHVLTQLFALAQLHQKDSATLTYAKTRARFNDRLGSPTERAAMFLYLNRTCFNGVWRTNKIGRAHV